MLRLPFYTDNSNAAGCAPRLRAAASREGGVQLKTLRGAIGVTVTPFCAHGQVDLATVEAQAQRLAQSDVTGVFPCASTGEFPHLSFPEQEAIYQATKRALAGSKTLVAGACAPNLRQAVAYAQLATALDYDACVACPPYYYPLTQDEVYRFYRELAQASPLPLILYHVPFFTTGIDLGTVERLLTVPGIVGMKDSSANMKRIAHLCQLHAKREDFILYTGTDDCLLPALAAGVDGSMTALGAGLPALVAGVYRAYAQGDLATATAFQQRMMPVLAAADALPFPLGYKLVAQACHGLPMTQAYHQLAQDAQVRDAGAAITTLVQAALAP